VTTISSTNSQSEVELKRLPRTRKQSRNILLKVKDSIGDINQVLQREKTNKNP